MSNEYKTAIEKNDKAIAVFKAVQAAFRAGTVDADTFLAAKAEHEKAMAEFDAAYAKESR